MYEVKSSETMYSGNFISVKRDIISLPDGGEAEREIVARGEASAILPINSEGDIVFVRQYRHGLGGMSLEIPAGVMDEGEDPIKCAKRELEEETGFIAGTIEHMFSMHTTVGFCDEVIHIYKGENFTQGKQNLDDDEFLEILVYSVKQAFDMIKSGKITDSKTIAAITAYIADKPSCLSGS